MAPLIITIDGPSAAGKSSVARELARRLNLLYLDSGALYRAMAWKVLQKGIDPKQQLDVETFCQGLHLVSHIGGTVFVDQEDVTPHLRLPEVSRVSSVISVYPGVREKTLALQKGLAQGGAVVEGRDIGTVVFPEAPFKFYLDADLSVRAERRFQEMTEKRIPSDRETVFNDMQNRDGSDRERTVAPLRPAPDATMINSTHFSLEEVIEKMLERIIQ
jgi:cytidylate kinase